MKTSRTTTTVTTTTRGRKIPAAPRKMRLVKRVRTITVRTAVVKLPKDMMRRIADAARPVKRAEVLSVTTTRALPAPKTRVSELTVRERQRLPDPR
jgi:hypothetical protein